MKSGLVVAFLMASVGAFAQCEDKIIRGDGTFPQPTDPPVARFKGWTGMYGTWQGTNYSTATMRTEVTALPDPMRPSITSQNPYNGSNPHIRQVANVVGGSTTAGCGYIFLDGQGDWGNTVGVSWEQQWPIQFSGQTQIWPTSTTNGYYRIRWYDDNNPTRELKMHAWVINGVWTVQPPAQETEPGGWEDTPVEGANGDGYITFIVKVGPDPLPFAKIVLRGQGLYGDFTAADDGMVHVGPIPPGTYDWSINYKPNISGYQYNNVTFAGAGTVRCNPNAVHYMQIVFRPDGTLAYTDESGDGGDGSLLALTDTGFWEALFEALFVPSPQTALDFANFMGEFYDWGPIGLMSQLTNLEDEVVGGVGSLIWMPWFQFYTDENGHRAWRMVVDPEDHNYDPRLNFTASIEQIKVGMGDKFDYLRSSLGIIVWLSWAWLMVQWVMPRFRF